MAKNTPTQHHERGYRIGVPKRRITVEILGTQDGYPRLSDFLKKLDAVKHALEHTERLQTNSVDRVVDYRIVSLSMSSPATVVLEEIPVAKGVRLPRTPITQKLVSTFGQIDSGRSIPPKARDLDALEAYRKVGAVLKGEGDALTISSDGKHVAINRDFNVKINKIIGPDQVLEGSVTGRLLAINLHNKTRFAVYPPAGPLKVTCNFARALKPRVIAALDRNVRVIGSLKYKHWAPHPHAITVDDIEVFPPNEELPTLTSLRGFALQGESPAPDESQA